MKEILGKNILIAGFGREGKSVINFLERQKNVDYHFTIADQEPNAIGRQNYTCYYGQEYLSHVGDFDTVVRSPGIPKTTPEFSDAEHITTATNIFFSECPGMVIGITGTKGKSTTSSLIHHILTHSGIDTRLVGNIGNPALDSLDDSTQNTMFVIELSSYQLDDIRYSPHIAVVLPIFQEHLNYHGTFDAYVQAKTNLVTHQTSNDFVIFYAKNQYSIGIAESSKAQQIAYPDEGGEGVSIWVSNDGKSEVLIPVRDIPLMGKANRENIMAAVTVARILGINIKHIQEAVRSFKPLEHRLELVGSYKGIEFYNDSLATIPEATIHALDSLEGQTTILIAGGYDRGLNFTPLAQKIASSNLQALILFPDTGKSIENLLRQIDSNTSVKIIHVDSMRDAVEEVYKLREKKGICLLSPSSASFNLFKDYADRGNQFKSLVRKYGLE